MGNNLRGVGLLSNIGDCPYTVQLGRHATIVLSERKDEERDDGELTQKWTMCYDVDTSSYVLELERRVIKHGGDTLFFNFYEDKCIRYFNLKIQRHDKTHLLEVEKPYVRITGKNFMVKRSSSTNAWGVYSATYLFFYRYGSINTKGSLIVVETKSESEGKKPYAATMVHYFAKGGGNDFFKTYKTDIGLSMVAKIGVSNNSGELEFKVEGPVQHPAASLLYMFDQVMRTGTWKPTSCPHCADNLKQRRSLLLQSDSEDSDGFQPPAGGQNETRHLSNIGGAYKGNGNGSFFERNKIYFGKGRS